MSNQKSTFTLTEDWTVVVYGFLIIILALLGLKIPNPTFGWKDSSELFEKVLTLSNLTTITSLFIIVYAIAILAAKTLGKDVLATIKGFPIVYILTTFALVLAGNAFLKNWNLEAVIFSLSIGLIISNFLTVPEWLKSSLSTELLVKIGLVILGTSVIFGDILKAGSLGLIQALLVVVSVWYFSFWVAKKLGVDEEMAIMLSSAVSICGVSAAIATSGAIKGNSKKLSYVISLVLITAIPMIIFMPFIAKALNLSEEVTGAWLGGTIDTTGAVIASGTLVGETALKISTIVKFSQNVLLGLAAFAISIYWTYTNNQSETVKEAKPTLGIIWERFPKFVIGFIAASLLFSFFVSSETINEVKGGLKSLQGLWFALAFTSIGLETKFSDLFNAEGKKPLYVFLIAQTFNVFITLAIAYLLFD
ncbi:putative integral membrane protein (TIGR00698 family) [Arcicella aurantiaca]|uniref:Putative integral membrane protein (TIGR00698 family) n=1 Tax=Arcicella aurantiaca TaxID=591202 RepID=A0A316EIE2_9BACT|nr:putative sulfate exporter family transporter [Arcicella aurantiaca]PWK29328.1 putative integral membrane protein (TIGR00698 family) [Arcicella aurantiaca]